MKDIRYDLSSMDLAELGAYFEEKGEPKFRAKQVFSWINKKCAPDFSVMTDLKKDLRSLLEKEAYLSSVKINTTAQSLVDGTRKFLFELYDGCFVEGVLMEYEYGLSACISTQAGCAMGCIFCASGKSGFERNLTTGEITGQIYAMIRHSKKSVSRIVFMGVGEPLLNFDNVIRAIKNLCDPEGLNLSMRHISISTCGIVPGIIRLADEGIPVTLALSLHAAKQEKRESIMPVAKNYNLSEVLKACDYYREKTGRRITYEYCLMGGVNDTAEDIKDLTGLLKDKDVHLNIIPCHEIRENSSAKRADASAFKNKLEKYGINVTIRRGLGQDIDAACGQLRAKGMGNRV